MLSTEEEIRTVDLDVTPVPNEVSTPDISSSVDPHNNVSDSDIDSNCDSDDPSDSHCDSDVFSNNADGNAFNILREIRVKSFNKIVIGTLNINSLASKFEELKYIISNSLDILIIQETKLDSTFPNDQFLIEGYRAPYRLDRNRNGGGVMIYVGKIYQVKN